MDMEQLIGQITQQTGISSDLAKQGTQLVGGFLKGKLPVGAGGALDTLLGGQTISTPQLAQATSLDQITAGISQYTKIPVGAAKILVHLVGNFLADKLPAPFGEQVNGLLGVSGEHGGVLEQAKDVIGSLFGHRD